MNYESKFQRKVLALTLLALAAYIVIAAVLLYSVYQIASGLAFSVFPFFHSGAGSGNFIPFLDYFRLMQSGSLGAALFLLAGQLLVYIAPGILIPMLHPKSRSYLGILLWGLFFSVVLIVPNLIFNARSFNIDFVILLFAGLLIGFWIWKRLIPGHIGNAVTMGFGSFDPFTNA